MFCNSFKRKLKYGLKYGCCSFNFFHKPVATEWLDTVHTRARFNILSFEHAEQKSEKTSTINRDLIILNLGVFSFKIMRQINCEMTCME